MRDPGTRRWPLVALAAVAMTCACARHSPSAPGGSPPAAPDSLALERITGSLSFPVGLAVAPGDRSRLFVVEKAGRIRVVRNDSLLAQPFLDLTGQVSGGTEQGLLGLAFDPGYAANGRFYVDYTDLSGNTHVVRYRVSSDPEVANPTPDLDLLTVTQPYANHNGGQLAFGPDGMLYVSLGDGGSAGDPSGTGQDRTDLLGSILRLDVSGAGGYAIPPDNPFHAPDAPEVWCYGLRNPWRFSFDRATGDLYIGDVGQDRREEVDVARSATGRGRGLDFGWNIMEGTACYNPSSGCDTTGLTMPVLDYTHSDGCSITGGYVYRGTAIPGLVGTYFYGDWCGRWVRSFRYVGGAATDERSWPSLSPTGGLTSFGEDAAGELYVLSDDGGLFRIVAP